MLVLKHALVQSRQKNILLYSLSQIVLQKDIDTNPYCIYVWKEQNDIQAWGLGGVLKGWSVIVYPEKEVKTCPFQRQHAFISFIQDIQHILGENHIFDTQNLISHFWNTWLSENNFAKCTECPWCTMYKQCQSLIHVDNQLWKVFQCPMISHQIEKRKYELTYWDHNVLHGIFEKIKNVWKTVQVNNVQTQDRLLHTIVKHVQRACLDKDYKRLLLDASDKCHEIEQYIQRDVIDEWRKILPFFTLKTTPLRQLIRCIAMVVEDSIDVMAWQHVKSEFILQKDIEQCLWLPLFSVFDDIEYESMTCHVRIYTIEDQKDEVLDSISIERLNQIHPLFRAHQLVNHL